MDVRFHLKPLPSSRCKKSQCFDKKNQIFSTTRFVRPIAGVKRAKKQLKIHADHPNSQKKRETHRRVFFRRSISQKKKGKESNVGKAVFAIHTEKVVGSSLNNLIFVTRVVDCSTRVSRNVRLKSRKRQQPPPP